MKSQILIVALIGALICIATASSVVPQTHDEYFQETIQGMNSGAAAVGQDYPTGDVVESTFKSFIGFLGDKNTTAASDLIAENCTGFVTGYKCAPLNKAGLSAVLAAFVGQVKVLGLKLDFSVVGYGWGAFMVEDMAIVKKPQNPAYWNFHFEGVLFMIQVNQQGKIVKLMEFTPSMPPLNNLTDIVKTMIVADKNKNASAILNNLGAGFQFSMIPSNPKQTPQQQNYTVFANQLENFYKQVTEQVRFDHLIYQTCGYVVVMESKMFEEPTQGYTADVALKGISILQFVQGKIAQWVSFQDTTVNINQA